MLPKSIMLSWIKKRCRRKSAPSCGIHKILSDSTYFDSENVPVNHEYEEIDDLLIPSSLAYAIVNLNEEINKKVSHSSSSEIVCRVCEDLKNTKATSSIKCTCGQGSTLTNQDYEEYEIPETVMDLTKSPIYENLPKPTDSKTNFAVFSHRPLPEIPQNVNSVCHKPMTKLSSFGELSFSDESSNSSGYFDSSYMTESESSSDDSFINEFEMLAIKRKEMVCRKNRRKSRLPEIPKPEVTLKQPRISTGELKALKLRPVNEPSKQNVIKNNHSERGQPKISEQGNLIFPKACTQGQGQLIYPQSQTKVYRRKNVGQAEPEVLPRQQEVEVSRATTRPRMGCRALTNSTMTRSRSTSRVLYPRFATTQFQSSFAVQRSLRCQKTDDFKSNNERLPTSYHRSISSPGLHLSPLTAGVTKTEYPTNDDDVYEDIF